jgi:hypothetical protein
MVLEGFQCIVACFTSARIWASEQMFERFYFLQATWTETCLKFGRIVLLKELAALSQW